MAPLISSPTTGVIITGGGSGIGLASARALAEAGRPVALWDLDTESVQKHADEIASEFGVASIGEGLDVSKSALYEPAIKRARSELGSLGGLVHCAGVAHPVPVDHLDEENWDAVLDINLRAEALLVRDLLPDLCQNEGSAVVGIASINAILGNGANPAYGASKAGLLGLTRSLAARLAPEGVRVNAICPGYVDTPMLATAFEHAPGLRESMESQSMLGRLSRPEEIARVVRFLLSNEASFITAEHIVVDGGVVRAQA